MRMKADPPVGVDQRHIPARQRVGQMIHEALDLPQTLWSAPRVGAVALHWVVAVVGSPTGARRAAKWSGRLPGGGGPPPRERDRVIGAREVEVNLDDGGLRIVAHAQAADFTRLERRGQTIHAPHEIQRGEHGRALEAVSPEHLAHDEHQQSLNGPASVISGSARRLQRSPWRAELTEPGTPRGLVLEYCKPLGCPVVADFPCGHAADNATLPLGARVTLDADTGTLEVIEPSCVRRR